MKKCLVIFAVMFWAFCFPISAEAVSFILNYDSVIPGLVDVESIITATPTANHGEYWITGVTGERNGKAITSFVTGGPGYFAYKDTVLDNLLYFPLGDLSHTGNSGFVIGTADGEFHPYWSYDNKLYEYKLGGGNGNPGIEITVNVGSVPEPTTTLLLGFGFLGLAVIGWKFNS